MRFYASDDVLDILMSYCPDDDGTCSNADADLREMLDKVEELSTIEIIHCEDCKYYWKSAQMCTNAEFPQSGTTMPYDFCSKGEPNEVTE